MSISISVIYLEFWEDDGEIRLEDERAWFLPNPIYFEEMKDEGRAKRRTSARSESERGRRCAAEGSPLHPKQKMTKRDF